VSQINAILIDPAAMTVSPVKVENTLQAYYALLQCSMVEAIRGPVLGTDGIYVDEEFLFTRSACPAPWWHIEGAHMTPARGRGLLVGTDADGDDVDAATPLETILGRLLWLKPTPVKGSAPLWHDMRSGALLRFVETELRFQRVGPRAGAPVRH
jgi:hypothetical protein